MRADDSRLLGIPNSRSIMFVFVMGQCTTSASTLTTHKHSPGKNKTKENKKQNLYTNLYSGLNIDLLRLLSLRLPSHYMLLYLLLLNLNLHPGSLPTPSAWVCHPPSPPRIVLASWRSLSWSLKRDTLRDNGDLCCHLSLIHI